MLQQHAVENLVHPGYGIADCHCAKGVAVIAGANCQQFRFFAIALRPPVLHCHFDRDFD